MLVNRGTRSSLIQVTNPMVVVSNRLPFVLVRKDDGSLERRMR